ncbi:MAG: hypothetical protein C0506_12735 [Anaerolinea sp.]|nr:hypothetical protein [Anaerolinea sp.]
MMRLETPPDDKPLPRDERLRQTLILLAKAFVFLGEEIAASGGVTAQQWAVLHQIGAAGEEGLLPSELAAANNTSRANITKFISRLGRLGYLAVSPSRTDRRKKLLRLTAAGQSALAKMDTEKRARLDEVLEAFAPRERADLLRLAEGLLRRLTNDSVTEESRMPTSSTKRDSDPGGAAACGGQP